MATAAQQRSYDEPLVGGGWVAFAGTMLILVGFFNVIDGIAAIANSDYLVHQLLFANMHAWGWFFLIFGAVQICAGFAILGGSTWAAIVGIASAFFNAIAQLSWARTYPVWAITAVVVDALVIYALVVYGGRRSRDYWADGSDRGVGPGIEGGAQPRLLVRREVRVNERDVAVRVAERIRHPVEDGVRAQQEERGRSGRHLTADVLDELVVDAGVGERAPEGAERGADREAEQRDEEDQSEQEPPEGAPEGALALQVRQLLGFRLPGAVRPPDDGGVLNLDQALVLEALQRREGLVGAGSRVELPDRETRHPGRGSPGHG